jgi:two-component system OmpR family sensor kinase
MYDLLFDNYLTVFGGLVIFLALGAVVGVAGWRMRKKMIALEQKLAGIPHLDSKDLYELLHSAVAHEFVRGLGYISGKSEQTLERLPQDQLVLRDQQYRIIVKAHELAQHAANILDLYAPQQAAPQQELLNIRHLVESVLVEFYPYAEGKGVTLRPNLDDIGPVLLNKNLTLESLTNVIQNAIKYSNPGGVVEVTLSLNDKGPEDRPGKWIWIDVKDAGKGIKKEDWDKIFQPRKRGDGLIEPGSGLGLYLARRAARRQGGDVILVSSVVNEGSTFRIILPYRAGELVA